MVKEREISPDMVEKIFFEHTIADGMMPMVLDMASSGGLNLYDQVGERNYLDFFGFFASNSLGMNHPKMRSDQAFLDRLLESALNKVTNSDIRTVHMARFLDPFGRIRCSISRIRSTAEPVIRFR